MNWLPYAPLGLLVASGLLIMLADAFSKERAELALLTAVSLGAAGAISLTALLRGDGGLAAPEFFEAYLSADSMSQIGRASCRERV